MNVKKVFTIGLAAIACVTLGAFKAFASAPPSHSDKVTVKKVKFKNRIDITVVGNLYIPKDIDKSKKNVKNNGIGTKSQQQIRHTEKNY